MKISRLDHPRPLEDLLRALGDVAPAAAELERLQAELATQRAVRHDLEDLVAEMRREIDRLTREREIDGR